ncbi:hypothetical protein ACFL27_24250, partial [candidate division CSSED10-310 bacterium]
KQEGLWLTFELLESPVECGKRDVSNFVPYISWCRITLKHAEPVATKPWRKRSVDSERALACKFEAGQ